MLGGKFAARLPRALLAFGTMGSTGVARGIPLPFEPFGQILVPALGRTRNHLSRVFVGRPLTPENLRVRKQLPNQNSIPSDDRNRPSPRRVLPVVADA
jgi:hypothetical protein